MFNQVRHKDVLGEGRCVISFTSRPLYSQRAPGTH